MSAVSLEEVVLEVLGLAVVVDEPLLDGVRVELAMFAEDPL